MRRRGGARFDSATRSSGSVCRRPPRPRGTSLSEALQPDPGPEAIDPHLWERMSDDELRAARRPGPGIDAILERAVSGVRLGPDDALRLLSGAPLLDLGLAADLVRRRLHPEPIVTYIVDRNINYTNVCVVRCSFCAFYRDPGHPEGYLHSKESLYAKIEETLALGGTGILMQGGHHPELSLQWYEDLLRSFKGKFPRLHVHAFSPPEIQHIVNVSSRPLEEVLRRLKAGGLDR